MSDRTRECVGLMGRIFGHKFEARITHETTSEVSDKVALAAINGGCNLRPAYNDVYHGDMCVRCGARAALVHPEEPRDI